MEFYRSNLLIAINIAIKEARTQEANHGYTGDSGFVAGLVQLQKALENGENVILIKD